MSAEVAGMDYLFEIKNSVCARTIRYWAKMENGKMSAVVYWWLTDHVWGPPNFFERKFAYGFGLKNKNGKNIMTINSLKKREIELVVMNGKITPVTSISGRRCVLERIFVMVIEGTFKIPKVPYVDVFGKDLETNQDLTERITEK